MDKDPSGTPFSNERDFFESLDSEMQNEIIERDERDFIEAISVRSDIINKIIEAPNDPLLLIAINNTHDQSIDAFEKYVRGLFDVPMDDDIRQQHITSAFIDTDYSQRALNQLVFGDDSGYDIDGLSAEIEEFLEYEDDVAEEEVMNKFRADFGEDIIEFLDRVGFEDDDDDFWTSTKINLVDSLDTELKENDFINAIDNFYKSQDERLDAIEEIETEKSDIFNAHQKMINSFQVCVKGILNIPMEASERIELIAGLFVITDNTQNELFVRADEHDKRTEDDIRSLHEQIAMDYKKCSHNKFSSRVVGLYKKEFTNDLTILLDKFGRSDR
jgi:hypothetical protein